MNEILDKNIMYSSKEFQDQRNYWETIINKDILNASFSFSDSNLTEDDIEVKTFKYNFSEPICEKAITISNNSDETLLSIFIAITTTLMYKYYGKEFSLVSTTLLNKDSIDTIPNYILPIKSLFKDSMTIKDVLVNTRKNYINAYNNYNFPIEIVEKEFIKNYDIYSKSIFQTFVTLDTIHNDKYMENIDPNLIFSFHKEDKALSLTVKYKSNLYDELLIKTIVNNFNQLLCSAMKDLNSSLSSVEILDDHEKNLILNTFNDTQFTYDTDKLIHKLFEEQVEKTPNNIAIVFEGNSLTYKELNEKSNSLALVLRNYEIKNNDLVGIILDRSIEMVIALLGILKSGAAYVPIDPAYPKERIEYMLNDSNCKIAITNKEIINSISFQGKCLDIYDNSSFDEVKDNLDSFNKSNDLAYLIYTSGTTGKPKGVMVEHKQVINYIVGINREININNFSSILCITTICFDIFATEVLVPLAYGLKIVMANKEEQIDGSKLGNLITKNKIEIIQITPSRVEMMLPDEEFTNSIKDLKTLIIGGEKVNKNIIDKIYSYSDANIYNVYGPTETTIWSTIKLLSKSDEKITIGKPIQNTKIYIMSPNNTLLPIGMKGELCISGSGVSRGYLNNEILTKEKFIINPFEKDEVIYKTGDLAKWCENGEIDILGRIDNQIKLRGFRIELDEIEKALKNYDKIENVVVLPKNENKYLCAYVVYNGDFPTESVREYLKGILPEYMVPSQYVNLEQLPITPNGKLDKQKLLNLTVHDVNRIKIEPRNLQESVIREIWQEILHVEEIYIDDDFFELGGNSINIVQVSKQIERKLQVIINPSEIIAYSKLKDLAKFIIESSQIDESNRLKHIFKINQSTSKEKIFLFHGGDSDIYYYRYLAKLLEHKYSVYGIQPKGLDGKDSLPVSYYEMLYDYIKEIKKIQPNGPYILGGYCVGGYCSYDTTKIFELQGEKVTLIQIDQEPFVNRIYLKGAIKREPILRLIEIWRRINKKDYIYTIEKFRKIYEKQHVISKEHQLEVISSRKNIFTFFTKELLRNCNYAPCAVSIKSPTIVIKAEGNHCEEFEIASWDNMAKGNLEFHEIPGGHLDMVLPPYVDKVAELILQFLDK